MHKITVLKKCFCLMLSIFLLTPNAQLFAQDANAAAAKLFQKEMKEIRNSYRMVSTSLQALEDVLTREAGKSAMRAMDKEVFVPAASEEYNALLRASNERTTELLTALDDLSKRYESYLSHLSKEEGLDNLAVKYIRNKIQVSNEAIRELKADLALRNNRGLSLEEALSKVKGFKKMHRSYKALLFTDPATLVNELYGTSEQLARGLQFGLVRETEKSQEAVRVALRAEEARTPETAINIAREIKGYFRSFVRKASLRKFDEGSLAKAIMKMSSREVEKLIGLTPEERVLLKDIRATEETLGKKIVSRVGPGPLVVVFAFVIPLTITGFAANAAYGQNSIAEKTILYNKIKSGDATLPEAVQFYTDEANTATIVNDEELFADMVNIYSKAIVADEDSEELLNLMNATQAPADLSIGLNDINGLILDSLNNFDINSISLPEEISQHA